MKNKITVASLNVSQASLLTGKTRETVSRAARGLPSSNGVSNAKFFDSRKLLQLLYLGESGPTYSEAMRRLALSRTALLDHELTERRAETVPIEEHKRTLVTLIALFRGMLTSRFGKTIDNALLGSCHQDLQEFVISIAPEGERNAIRKRFGEAQLDDAERHIERLKKDVAKDKWRREVDEIGSRLREAYNASQNDRSEAALQKLQAAQSAYRAAIDAEPGRPV